MGKEVMKDRFKILKVYIYFNNKKMKRLIFVLSNSYKINRLLKITFIDLPSLGYSLNLIDIPNLSKIQGYINKVIIDKTLKTFILLNQPCFLDVSFIVKH